MDKKKNYFLLLLLLVVLIGGAAALYNVYGDMPMPGQVATTEQTPEETEDTEENAPIPAPDFAVQDGEGETVRLSDFLGKPVVMNFWASWCGPCQYEMPAFEAKAKELDGEVVFMMVNAIGARGETVDTAKAFIEQSGYTFPVYYDVDHEATYAYGIYSYPTTFFIHADGTVAGYASGAMSEEFLQQCIDIIAE